MDKALNPLVRTSRLARCFSTSVRNAAPGPSRKPRQADDFTPTLDIRDLDVYKFDDPSSLGWLRLEKIREVQELFRKLEVDRPILQGRSTHRRSI
jgi:small subunit ribosomal protein S35